MKNDSKTLEELVEAAKHDPESWSALYSATYREAYFIANKISDDPHEAMDIVHDSYIIAMKKLDTLNHPEHFQSWFNRIVSRRCYDYLRKKKSTVFSDFENDDSDMIEWEDDREDIRPDLVLDHQESIRLVAEMIDALPEDQRLCVMMFYRDNLSVGQIARTLCISEGTVKSRLNYARAKVKAKVEALEKQGVKLYSIAPIPLLIWLLKYEASYAEVPAIVATAPASTLSAASGSSRTSAVATTASMTGKKVGFSALATKIIAGVAAVSIAIGGASVYLANKNKQNSVRYEIEAVPTGGSNSPHETVNTVSIEDTSPIPSVSDGGDFGDESSFINEQELYEIMLTEGITEAGFVPTYYAILDLNADGIMELILANADGTPDSWTSCELYTCKNGEVKYCGETYAHYDYLYHADDQYLIGQQRMGFDYLTISEKFSTYIYYWNEDQTRNDPAIFYSEDNWEYITQEEFELYNTLPGTGAASFIQKADVITLQKNTFLNRNLLAETLDLEKAWSIYEPLEGETYVTCYAFTDDGKVYCAVGPDRSSWFGYYTGTYTINGDEIQFKLNNAGTVINYVYQFNPQTLQFVQISENGLFHSHIAGDMLQLEEYSWRTADEMIRTIISYGGFEG